MKIERFTGINNRQPIDRLKPDEAGGMPVRDAVNVDLSASATNQRRAGYQRILAMPKSRDPFDVAGGFLFASESKLYKFDGVAATEVTTLTSEHSRIAYANTPQGVAWSDGFTLNLFDGTTRRILPNQPAPAVSAITGGSLIAGTYGVRFVAMRADGQQSAPTVPVYISVSDNGAIQVSSVGHTERVGVSVTAPDGEVFYRETALEVGQSTATIPLLASAGQPLGQDIVSALPAGSILEFANGRLLSVVGSVLFYSQPWAMGLYRPAYDFIPLADEITLVKSVEGGLYLATTKQTFFLAGGDISKASLTVVAPYGAAKGTLAEQPNSLNPMWHTSRGPVLADQSGGLNLLQDKDIAYPEAGDGTSIVRESNGLRQLITSLSKTLPSGGAVFGSYMDAKEITGATP